MKRTTPPPEPPDRTVQRAEETVAELLRHPNASPALDAMLDDLLNEERCANKRDEQLRRRLRRLRRAKG